MWSPVRFDTFLRSGVREDKLVRAPTATGPGEVEYRGKRKNRRGEKGGNQASGCKNLLTIGKAVCQAETKGAWGL